MSTPLPDLFKRVAPLILGMRGGSGGAGAAEGDIMVLPSGETVILVFEHPAGPRSNWRLSVRDYFSGGLIASMSYPAAAEIAFGCHAIDASGNLFVFGVCGDQQTFLRYQVDMSTWTLGSPVLIRTASSPFIYNTSVCADQFDMSGNPTRWTMVFEERTVVGGNITFTFARSSDLASWSAGPTALSPSTLGQTYMGCPSIKYQGGKYYFSALFVDGSDYSTAMFSTSNFSSYALASDFLMTPGLNEWISNSDVDYIEDGGVTYFYYLAGDQSANGDAHTAHYLGTAADLYTELGI